MMGSTLVIFLLALFTGPSSMAFDQANYTDVESSDTLGASALRKKPSKIKRYEVLDDLSRASMIVSSEDITLATKTASNNSPYETTSTLSVKVTETTTREWCTSFGVEMNSKVTISVTAKIPIIRGDVSSQWELGLTSSYSYTYGESFTSSITSNHDTSVLLPAYSDVRVAIFAKKAKVQVPYTSTVKIYYDRGDPDVKRKVRGVYKNARYASFETSVETTEMNRTHLYQNASNSGSTVTWALLSLTWYNLCTFCIWMIVLM